MRKTNNGGLKIQRGLYRKLVCARYLSKNERKEMKMRSIEKRFFLDVDNLYDLTLTGKNPDNKMIRLS